MDDQQRLNLRAKARILVASWPPLTDEQRDRLREAFRGSAVRPPTTRTTPELDDEQ
jgi:hypothetical protein